MAESVGPHIGSHIRMNMSKGLNHEERISRVAAELRSWPALAIIGAGISRDSGLPLVGQLQSLLWQAIDACEHLRESLKSTFGWSGSTAKELIGDDPLRTHTAYKAIPNNPSARRAYQEGFTGLNDQRASLPSRAHDVLAELLHRGLVEFVVSLNRDTLLEVAYRRRYGTILSADGVWLYKPHGDAAHPEADWILPHEKGSIPETIVQKAADLASTHPRVLLIIGYSESDEEVVSRLIGPLSGRWRVVRIGPGATDEWSIALPAEQALPLLVKALYAKPEVPGWSYVSFDNQRGLGSALLGRRLGHADVEACPRLPEVAGLKQVLLTANSAVVVGKSGSGKSITAYQAAYDLCREGWEVLRIIEPERDLEELVFAVTDLRRKSILLVDDGQSLDRRLILRLLDLASDSLLVVIISTDDIALKHDIEVASARAVTTIADALKTRRAETLAVIRNLDDRVGESYLDTPLEMRLEEAAKSDFPWQFSFVLTGGDRRARNEIAALREKNRTDLLLTAVAAGQLVSLDAGSTQGWLGRAAGALGKDGDWVDFGLIDLLVRRLLIAEDRFRCPHLAFAGVVLRYVCKSRSDPAWQSLVSMFRECVLYGPPPLCGVSWLLNELKYTDAIWHRGSGTIIDDDTWRRLLERCLAARNSIERRDALFVLEALQSWHASHIEFLTSQAALLGRWLQEVDTDTAYSIATLLNNLYHKKPELSKAICNHADPTIIASSLAGISLSDSATFIL